MDHIPTSSHRKLLEDTTIRLGVWNHVCTARDPTRKWLSSISTSLLASRLLLLLTSGLLVLLLLLLSRLLLLTGLTLGKIGLGILFPTPPLPTSLTSLTAHLPSPNSIRADLPKPILLLILTTLPISRLLCTPPPPQNSLPVSGLYHDQQNTSLLAT